MDHCGYNSAENFLSRFLRKKYHRPVLLLAGPGNWGLPQLVFPGPGPDYFQMRLNWSPVSMTFVSGMLNFKLTHSRLFCWVVSTQVLQNMIRQIGGERGGSVVECRTPEREVRGWNLPPPCCVLEQDTLLPESTGYLPRKRWLRPDMTEKLLTGTLSLNTTNQPRQIGFNVFWFALLFKAFKIVYCMRKDCSLRGILPETVQMWISFHLCLTWKQVCHCWNWYLQFFGCLNMLNIQRCRMNCLLTVRHIPLDTTNNKNKTKSQHIELLSPNLDLYSLIDWGIGPAKQIKWVFDDNLVIIFHICP